MEIIGNVEKDAQVRAVASGALPSGDAVIVNSDGTVSVVEETDVSTSVGTPVTWQTAAQEDMTVVFDPEQEKFVLVYNDAGNQSKGTARVGTVSGATVSFGGSTTYSNPFAGGPLSVGYDSTNGKIIIAYRDGGNSDYGTAVVGTVSGTSISFGTPVVFNSAATGSTGVAHDTANNKTLIVYRKQTNSGRPTGIVGTVSGTGISFGSETTLDSSSNQTLYLYNVYDPSSGKFLVVYSDSSDGEDGKAFVATISGTSVSAGSVVKFEASGAYQGSVATDGSGKFVVAYRDNGDSLLKSVVATISGTTPTFTAAQSAAVGVGGSRPLSITYDANEDKYLIVFRKTTDGSNVSRYVVATMSGTTLTYGADAELISNLLARPIGAFDSVQNKILIAYADSSDSSKGKALVFENAYTTTNLTSENFLGFAAHTYADTQSALVNSTCTVDRNQTSLTAGQTYYVQTDGSLGTTAADPSVEAGTAISSTEIIVKG